MQRVAGRTVGRAQALFGGEDVGAGQMHAQLIGDKPGGLRPVGVGVDGVADAGDQTVELVDGSGEGGGHGRSACCRMTYLSNATYSSNS